MRRRRRRSRRLVKLLFVLACVSCFLCGFRFGGARTIAMAEHQSKQTEQVTDPKAENSQQNQKERRKYYTCIVIETGDSLYKIAEHYMSDEYESLDQYVSEIKKINGMISNNLEQGEYLTVPYYSYV